MSELHRYSGNLFHENGRTEEQWNFAFYRFSYIRFGIILQFFSWKLGFLIQEYVIVVSFSSFVSVWFSVFIEMKSVFFAACFHNCFWAVLWDGSLVKRYLKQLQGLSLFFFSNFGSEICNMFYWSSSKLRVVLQFSTRPLTLTELSQGGHFSEVICPCFYTHCFGWNLLQSYINFVYYHLLFQWCSL